MMELTTANRTIYWRFEKRPACVDHIRIRLEAMAAAALEIGTADRTPVREKANI